MLDSRKFSSQETFQLKLNDGRHPPCKDHTNGEEGSKQSKCRKFAKQNNQGHSLRSAQKQRLYHKQLTGGDPKGQGLETGRQSRQKAHVKGSHDGTASGRIGASFFRNLPRSTQKVCKKWSPEGWKAEAVQLPLLKVVPWATDSAPSGYVVQE